MYRNMLTAIIVLTCCSVAQGEYADNRSAFGITVHPCTFEMDNANFCSDDKMRKFAQIMHKRAPNFADNYLLYIYYLPDSIVNGHDHSYRMVVIDPQRKRVFPFEHAFHEAETPVNDQGDKLEYQFSRDSTRFCYKGTLEAYRDSYDYSPDDYPAGFCFDFQPKIAAAQDWQQKAADEFWTRNF